MAENKGVGNGGGKAGMNYDTGSSMEGEVADNGHNVDEHDGGDALDEGGMGKSCDAMIFHEV